MALWKPDTSFYPSPRMAMQAPPERHAYVVALNVGRSDRPDVLNVVDLDPHSSTYSQTINTLEMPYSGDEFHHFGWNACSSALCPYAPHPHLERRYLIVPGIRSSRIYIIDTKPNPTQPKIVKIIEPEEILEKTGYSRPHTVHCGPDAIYISALASGQDGTGPGGIFMLDHFNFNVIGPWELYRGDQDLAYDFWWHLADDIMMTSEWAKPTQFENGLIAEDLLANRYGHRLHFWDLRKRRLSQSLDLGAEHQMVLELRPAHEPNKTYGFVCVVVSTADLSASIWTWYKENNTWKVKKTISIPPVPAAEKDLPAALKPFQAVPPLVTDIDLSLDDKFLYVSCWGTGELLQYNVSDPFAPKLTGKVAIGGIVPRKGHPKWPSPLAGGPQMVELSRDGRRVYFTSSLYSSWDDQFYEDRTLEGWMVKVNANPAGGMEIDPDFFVHFGETRSHQIRLEGGDASTDTFCYPS